MGKVNSEIVTYRDRSNYVCFDEVLKEVNKIIEENKISKSDILEYKSDNFYDKNTEEWCYTVTFSWWKD